MKHLKPLAALVTAMLSAACGASAQEPTVATAPPPLPFPGELTQTVFKDGDYLTPVLEMERRREEYRASEMWGDLYAQMLAMQLSFAGENAAALALEDLRSTPDASAAGDAGMLAGLRARDAVEVVARAARTHQAVFVNEAHHVPRHRAFTRSLLRALYDQGFRYLAVEAVTERDTALNTRRHPLFRQSGLYVNEPAFGDLVRTALEMGWTVVPYDVTERIPPRADQPAWAANERERIQAQNLADRILKADPAARILVHAGYDHVREDEHDGVTPMAGQFRRITGIDPFTVDQVEMMEHSSPAYESPVYQAAARGGLARSTIFVSASEVPWAHQDVDAQVFHPRETAVQGRPAWLLLDGERRPYTIRGVPHARPVLLQAFRADEGITGIPVDQFVLSAGAAAGPVLVLAPGRYLLRVVEPGGRVLREGTADAGRAGTINLP